MSQACGSSFPPSQSALTRLPTVLVHLVMQALQMEDLVRLACTCRLMRADSLHPSAGVFLRCVPRPFDTGYTHSLSLKQPHSDPDNWSTLRLYSPLGRAQLAVTLTVYDPQDSSKVMLPPVDLIAALTAQAAGWSHVDVLDVRGAEWWAAEDAIRLLSHPSLQRVRLVVNLDGVWMTESVQTAVCRLPRLSSFHIGRQGDHPHPCLRLHPAAMGHATALRSISFNRSELPTYRLAGLICVPQLTRLELSTDNWTSDEEQPAEGMLAWMCLHLRPLYSNLRMLLLDSLNLGNQSRRDMRAFFGLMSQLRYLRTESWHPNAILRGLIDAGADALPELRVVAFWQYPEDHQRVTVHPLSSTLLLRFLRLFPQSRYCLTHDGVDGQYWLRQRFELWERVCVKANHAEPDSDGMCGECTDDGGEQWTPVEGSAVPVEEPETDEEQAELAALMAEPELPSFSPEESLRLSQLDYERALAEAGPWMAPSVPSKDAALEEDGTF